MSVIRFRYNACRRVHSRKPRRSKNGTPEERAAKAAQEMTSPPADVAFIGNAKPDQWPDEFRKVLAGLDESDRQYMAGYMRALSTHGHSDEAPAPT